MITYKKGDLLLTTDKIIVHGCNCQGVMGAGVAKQIKEKYPKAFLDYLEFFEFRGSFDLLGCNRISIQPDGKLIINCFTQFEYGNAPKKRYVSYDAIDKCMSSISTFVVHDTYGKNISMPKIGAGFGGGEWSIIESIINFRLKDFNVTVWEF